MSCHKRQSPCATLLFVMTAKPSRRSILLLRPPHKTRAARAMNKQILVPASLRAAVVRVKRFLPAVAVWTALSIPAWIANSTAAQANSRSLRAALHQARRVGMAFVKLAKRTSAR